MNMTHKKRLLDTSYREHPLRHLDRQRVEALWSFAPRQTGMHRVLPDGRIDLLARFNLDELGTVSNIRLVIAGPAQRYSMLPTSRDTAFLGIRFRAGWGGACLGVSPAGLRDKVLLGEDAARMLSPIGLPLLRARTVDQLEAALVGVARTLAGQTPRRPSHNRAIDAINLLHASGGDLSVAELATTVGTSERTLRRDVMDTVGLSVKSLSSILRFQRTLALLETRPLLSLTEAALEGGYSDQAHMTREFRYLGGFTPGARPEVALTNLSM